MKIIGSILIAVIGLAAMCLCSLLFPAAISAFVSYVVFVAFYNKKMQKRIAHEEAFFQASVYKISAQNEKSASSLEIAKGALSTV